MNLRARLADALARLQGMQTRRCPEACGLVIRYRAVSEVEAKRFDAIAADHDGRHQYRD